MGFGAEKDFLWQGRREIPIQETDRTARQYIYELDPEGTKCRTVSLTGESVNHEAERETWQ